MMNNSSISEQERSSTSEGVFNPSLRIKEEDTSSDNEVATENNLKKYRHLLKPMLIKMEPLDNSKVVKSKNITKRTFVNEEPRKKSKEIAPRNQARIKDIPLVLPGKSPVKKKAMKLSSANANLERKSRSVANMKPKNVNDKGDHLDPDDLRYLIAEKVVVTGREKKESGLSMVAPDSELLDYDENSKDDLDSMSIHADDDDLLESNLNVDDFNKLGQSFAAADLGDQQEKPTKRKSSSNFGKRKQSETYTAHPLLKQMRKSDFINQVSRSKSLDDAGNMVWRAEQTSGSDRKKGDTGRCQEQKHGEPGEGTMTTNPSNIQGLGRSLSDRGTLGRSHSDSGMANNPNDTGETDSKTENETPQSAFNPNENRSRREALNSIRIPKLQNNDGRQGKKHDTRENELQRRNRRAWPSNQRGDSRHTGTRQHAGRPRMNIVRPNVLSQSQQAVLSPPLIPNVFAANLFPNSGFRQPLPGVQEFQEGVRNKNFSRPFYRQPFDARKDKTPSMEIEKHPMYSVLMNCLETKNLGNCVVACKEIIRHFGGIDIRILERLMKVAAEVAVTLNPSVINFILWRIREEREDGRLVLDDYTYALEAFGVLEAYDDAIVLVLEMVDRGFEPPLKDLLMIQNGVIVSSTTNDIDRLVQFWELLEGRRLNVKRAFIEVVLRHVSVNELKAKTRNQQILQMVKEMEIPEKPSTSPRFQPQTPTLVDDTKSLFQKIQGISSPENIPADLLVKLIKSIKSLEDAFLVMAKLANLPEEVLSAVDNDLWNDFLSKSCHGPFAHLQLASQIQGTMVNKNISIDSAVSLQLICYFVKEHFVKDALQLVNDLKIRGLEENDVTDDVYECLASLLTQNQPGPTHENMKIAMIMIKAKRLPPEDKLISVISSLKSSSNYQQIWEIMTELKESELKAPKEAYLSALSALEDWDENLEAYVRVQLTMKKLYPSYRIFKEEPSTAVVNINESVSSVYHTENLKPRRESISTLEQNETRQSWSRRTSSETEVRIAGPPIQHAATLQLKSPFEELMTRQSQVVQPHLEQPVNITNPPSSLPGEDPEDIPDSGYLSNGSGGNSHAKRSPSISGSQTQIISQEVRQLTNMIIIAASSYNYEKVCQTYVELRKCHANLANDVLSVVYKAIIRAEPVERFKQLLNEVRLQIPGIHTVNEDDDIGSKEPLILLQDEDQENLGRLAVRLLLYFFEKCEMTDGFDLLCLLHESGINYFLYGRTFDLRPSLTTTEIVMTAVKVCLGTDPPNLDGAVVVLQSSNYGLPVETPGDDSERRHVIFELLEKILEEENFQNAYDVIDGSFEEENISPNSWFNKVLLRYAEENQVLKANGVYEFIKNEERIPIDSKSFRAYLNCLSRAGHIRQAKELFEIGRRLEIYPSQDPSDPYFFEVPCNLTRFEMLFMLETHLRLIKSTVFHGKGTVQPLMKSQTAFKIIFKENYELFDTSKEQIMIAKENMVAVLTEMMKPPLKIVETEIPDEPLVIGVTSLLGWYRRIDNINKEKIALATPIQEPHILETPESPPVRREVLMSETGSFLKIKTTTDVNHNKRSCQEEDKRLGTWEAVSRGDLLLHICEKVKMYERQGKVEDFDQCVRTISKLFLKQCKEKVNDHSVDLKRNAETFVENFFKVHGVFLAKFK